jgi:membrane fusion protein (multidrug efflux system)
MLMGVKPGMAVAITLDAYPDLPLTGRIDSFSPASGSRFSIIPPENATGNFTRIVQRLPVKILLDKPLPAGVQLTPGLSAKVEVDLRQ